jgi:hypothetical protein
MTTPYTSDEEARQAVYDHMLEPMPVGHGFHPDAVDPDFIRHHQYEHKFSTRVTHEHQRPEKD